MLILIVLEDFMLDVIALIFCRQAVDLNSYLLFPWYYAKSEPTNLVR